MTEVKDNSNPPKKILTESRSGRLMKRIYGEDGKSSTLSERMQRDQRSAERINTWVNRFTKK